MARQRTRVRVARSLRAVILGAVAAGAATALFELDLGRDLSLPLGLLALAPPAIYVLLALVVLREAPAGQKLSWAMAACGVNAALGLATSITLSFAHPLSFEGAVTRAFGAFVPAPLIHLAAAPMVLLAFRSRVVPARAAARGTRAAASRTPVPVLATATPNYDDVLRQPPSPQWVTGPGQAVFERARPREAEPTPAAEPAVETTPVAVTAAPAPVAAPPPVAPAAPPTPPPAASKPAVPSTPSAPREPAPARKESPAAPEPMLRVAFDRLAAQLPPDVFVVPPRRLSESLREPHTLVVPQRLVVPQLGEGMIEIPWTLVEDQFPDLSLAMPRAEVRKRFPDWVLSLPLDEVIGQIPADLFHVTAPAADLTEIGKFPAPFKPGPPIPESELEEPPVVVASNFAGPPAPSAPPAAPPPPPAPPEPAASAPAPSPAVMSAPVSSVPAASAPAAGAPAPSAPRPSPPSAPPVPPPPAPGAPADAPVVTRPARRDEQLVVLARALAVLLAPAGALECGARRVGSVPLVCFASPALEREAIDALAARGLALLERLAAWSIDQVTVRTSRLACVLAPLAAGGAVAAAVRRGAPIAMLEILTARARGGAAHGVARVSVPPAATVTPVTDGNGRVGEAARALAVLGAIVPTEAAPERNAPGVYVFAGRADAALAGAARAVHETLVTGHDEGALGRLESVALRHGRERVIVRPLRMAAGAPALLAAAGEVPLTGRAQRAAARAATLLEAR